jgi:hypothetical protein
MEHGWVECDKDGDRVAELLQADLLAALESLNRMLRREVPLPPSGGVDQSANTDPGQDGEKAVRNTVVGPREEHVNDSDESMGGSIIDIDSDGKERVATPIVVSKSDVLGTTTMSQRCRKLFDKADNFTMTRFAVWYRNFQSVLVTRCRRCMVYTHCRLTTHEAMLYSTESLFRT